VIDQAAPDLATALHVDIYAPRAARHYVSQVKGPSPDLRDAVTLLTSELVTRALQQRPPGFDCTLELCVWAPEDVVRVELRGPPEVLAPAGARAAAPAGYELVLLEQLANRWSIDAGSDEACAWFEIDRHGPVTVADF
jgi:hypothetical protein